MYGLTWGGFISSIAIREVSDNILHVLGKNPILALPEKELVLLVLKEIVTQEELAAFSRSLLEVFLEVIPSLELIRLSQLRDLSPWLVAIK